MSLLVSPILVELFLFEEIAEILLRPLKKPLLLPTFI